MAKIRNQNVVHLFVEQSESVLSSSVFTVTLKSFTMQTKFNDSSTKLEITNKANDVDPFNYKSTVSASILTYKSVIEPSGSLI